MDTITELLEYMDREGQTSVNVQNDFGQVIAVVVRIRPASGLAYPTTQKKKGRTPKGTKLSRRQRQAAKAGRR